MRFVFALAAAAITAATFTNAASAVTIADLNNTGAGFALGTNGIDSNWRLGIETPAFVSGTNGVFPVAMPWIADTETSRRITPTNNAGDSLDPVANDEYFYTTSFDLTGYNVATSAFTGRFSADNGIVSISLNGSTIAGSGGNFTTWTNFSSAGGVFNAGVNVLQFTVTNFGQPTGNPSGLRVEFLSSETGVGAIPEPAAWAMLIAGFGLVGAVARRRRSLTTAA